MDKEKKNTHKITEDRHLFFFGVLLNYMVFMLPFVFILAVLTYTGLLFDEVIFRLYLAISYIAPLIISIFWTYGHVSYPTVEAVRKFSILIVLVLLVIGSIILFVPWTIFLTQLAIADEIQYLEAIIPTTSFVIMCSIILFARSIRRWAKLEQSRASYETDMHYKVCRKMGVEYTEVFQRYRQRREPYYYQENFYNANLRNSENNAEITLSLFMVSILSCIFVSILWMMRSDMYEDTGSLVGLLPTLLMMTSLGYYALKGRYSNWKYF